jgi:hypothetical protein
VRQLRRADITALGASPPLPSELVSRHRRGISCGFCRRVPAASGFRFYFARGLTICEVCIDILHDLLEAERSSRLTPRPTPRPSNAHALQQVNSPP